jgi:cysteine desulfurase family protein (TIGR01976 family)
MDVTRIRSEFPALHVQPDGDVRVFLDNAAGTQVTQRCLDRINDYLLCSNANLGGVFPRSHRSDALIAEGRAAVADLLGATDPREICFGQNMTTLTQAFARAFGRTCRDGDEIVTTRLEHEANVSPWLALEERGVVVRFADIRTSDVTIDLESLASQLCSRTRLVAVGLASNTFGTINPVRQVARLAHDAGALCFVDAVHYAPHGPLDVAELECDFLVCSVYKFFGPHVGVLWGRAEALESIPPYHLRTVPACIPDKFETGTLNHEGIAGALGAIDYLEQLGPPAPTRRHRLLAAMTAIRQYECELSTLMNELLTRMPYVRLHGIAGAERVGERVPTFALTVDGLTPQSVAERLASLGIDVWHGHNYALEPVTRLGLTDGVVRVSPVHYNTAEELLVLAAALEQIAN